MLAVRPARPTRSSPPPAQATSASNTAQTTTRFQTNIESPESAVLVKPSPIYIDTAALAGSYNVRTVLSVKANTQPPTSTRCFLPELWRGNLCTAAGNSKAPHTQSKWYARLKAEWIKAAEEGRPFENPI